VRETVPENVSETMAMSASTAIDDAAVAAAEAPAPMAAETSCSVVAEEPVPLPVVASDEAMLELEKEASNWSMARAEAQRLVGIEMRILAKKKLAEAIESKDFDQLQQALVAAKEANLGICAETELARSLLAPLLMVQEVGATASSSLSAVEASDAEMAATAEMTEDELRARVIELSRCVASERLYTTARLEEDLAAKMEVVELASIDSLEEGLKRLKVQYDDDESEQCMNLDTQLGDMHREVLVAARIEASKSAEQKLSSDEVEMRKESNDIAVFERSVRLDEVVSFSSGLQQAEEALTSEKDSIEHSSACNSLSQAVLLLEDAILAGRPCLAELESLRLVADQADVFSANLLAQLPDGCIAICRQGSVPSEDAIRQHLPAKLHALSLNAFLPPGGGLAAELLACVFRRLYLINSEAQKVMSGVIDPADEVRINLEATSRLLRASRRKTPGELEEALRHLEGSLSGYCFEEAKNWLHDTRCALSLRQVIWAVKARVQCLTSRAA
jgi:hypothetical protein